MPFRYIPDMRILSSLGHSLPARSAWLAIGLAAAAPGVGRVAAAQTDYYNTDSGRPITVEDAYPVERRAFELQLAPLRVERSPGGLYAWGIEPELAYGILPRTHVELGFPLAFRDGPAGVRSSGLAGVEVGIFHNLNVETTIPALALAAEAIIAAGPLAPDRTYASAKAVATKTFPWARFHVNGQYTFGDEPAAMVSAGGHEISRWMAGVAIDRTMPLRSLLLTGEVVARQPIHADDDIAWDAGTGLRYQYSPRVALDAGIARQLTGDERAWSLTLGAAYAFGLAWYPR